MYRRKMTTADQSSTPYKDFLKKEVHGNGRQYIDGLLSEFKHGSGTSFLQHIFYKRTLCFHVFGRETGWLILHRRCRPGYPCHQPLEFDYYTVIIKNVFLKTKLLPFIFYFSFGFLELPIIIMMRTFSRGCVYIYCKLVVSFDFYGKKEHGNDIQPSNYYM